MESQNLYEDLASHFDRFPIGTPKTPALMEILRILFPVEEAEVALRMPIMGKTTISDLGGESPAGTDRLEAILDRMAEKIYVKGAIVCKMISKLILRELSDDLH